MLTYLQYKILTTISPGEPDGCNGSVYQGKSKLATLLGQSLLRKIPGTVAVDFGCGEGHEVIELANAGARRVIGVDYRNDILEVARAMPDARVWSTCVSLRRASLMCNRTS